MGLPCYALYKKDSVCFFVVEIVGGANFARFFVALGPIDKSVLGTGIVIGVGYLSGVGGFGQGGGPSSFVD